MWYSSGDPFTSDASCNNQILKTSFYSWWTAKPCRAVSLHEWPRTTAVKRVKSKDTAHCDISRSATRGKAWGIVLEADSDMVELANVWIYLLKDECSFS